MEINAPVPEQQGYAGINIQPTIEPVPVLNSKEPYGGVSPTVETTIKPEEPKVIYGGADPLAGTGIIPTVTPTPEKKEDIESL